MSKYPIFFSSHKNKKYSAGILFNLLFIIILVLSSSVHSRPTLEELDKELPDILPIISITGDYKNKIIIGITPWKDTDALILMYKPLAQYISERLGISVDIHIAESYNALALRIAKGTFDIGFFSPYAYVKAMKLVPDLKYVATLQKYDSEGSLYDHYQGNIISLKKSAFDSLIATKNTRFAFTSKSSTSGYLYPKALLLSKQIKPDEFFAKVLMLKKHDKVIRALVDGNIDVGATWDGVVSEAIIEHGDIFSVLAKTKSIPLDAIAIGGHNSKELTQQIQQTLINLTPDSQIVKRLRNNGWPYAGIIIRSDSFYDSIRQVDEELNNSD